MAISGLRLNEADFDFKYEGAVASEKEVLSSLNQLILKFKAIRKQYAGFADNKSTKGDVQKRAKKIVSICDKRIKLLEKRQVAIEKRISGAMMDYIGVLDENQQKLDARLTELESKIPM